jgi:hypothetical protein
MFGGMEVSFGRGGGDSCELIIRRDDGVELRGHAHGGEDPRQQPDRRRALRGSTADYDDGCETLMRYAYDL